MPHLVFISHSGADTWVARQLASVIEARGASTFLDEAQISVGADFEEEILVSLNGADELVVLLTPWAMKRPYVWAELGAAWARRIPIVVLLLGVTPSDLDALPGGPVFLKKRNLIELNNVDRYLDELSERATDPRVTREATANG